MKLTCLLRFFISFCVITIISDRIFAQAPDASTVPPPAAGSEQPIVIRADNVTSIGDIFTGDGNAVVTSNGETLYADHITFDRDTRFATASGNARLYGSKSVYRGEHMTYNFITKAVTATTFTSQEYPKYIGGKSVTTIEENHYRLFHASLTTDDRVHPSFHIEANQVEYRPGEDVVMKNVVVYIGDVPVFYVPILVQSLKDDRPTYTFNIGESSQFGFFFYNDLNFVLDKKVKLNAQLDYREKRGVGFGLNASYSPPNTVNQNILFNAYYIHDDIYDPVDNSYPGHQYRGNYSSNGSDVYDGVNGPDRYRLSLQDNLALGDDFQTLANVGIWSDPFVTRDFFPGDYSSERQPDSVGALSRYIPDYNLSLTVRARTNTFFESVDRLPELDLDVKQQPIFNSPIQYSSQTSVVYFDRRFADASQFRNPAANDSFYAFNNPQYPINNYYNNDPALRYNINQHNNYSAFRYDTYHEFEYPHQYFNFLSLTPRIGGRFTYYSDDNRDLSTNNDGIQNDVNPRARLAGDVGLEGDFKVSKTWTDIRSSTFGIDGIRHVMEPYFNSQFAPSPTVTPNEIRPFDARLISDQLQPINFPDYNSIDSIDKQAVVRMGVDNKIQTKRDNANVNLFEWDSFLDADFDHNFSSTHDDLFSNWFNNFTVSPIRNWSYSAKTSVAVESGGYNEVSQGINFSPDPSLTIGLGENYINHSPLFPDSNQAYLNLQYRLNEHWQFDTTQSFEAATGQVQEQQFIVHRDLEAWDAALTFQNQLEYQGIYNQTVYLSFTLKALPQRSLHTPSTPVGGTGGSATSGY